MFAKIENNQVVEWPIPSLAQLFPNISFPNDLTNAELPEGYVFVGVSPAPTPSENEKVVPGQPIQQGDRWVQGWEIVELTPEELQQRRDTRSAEVRDQRNRLLAQTDWTQVADAPVDKQAWAQYRQALRTITEQPSFPFDVIWPQMPV